MMMMMMMMMMRDDDDDRLVMFVTIMLTVQIMAIFIYHQSHLPSKPHISSSQRGRQKYSAEPGSNQEVCEELANRVQSKKTLRHCVSIILTVQFRSVQDGIYALGKADMRSTPSLSQKFP